MCVVCVTMSSKKTGGRGARGFKKGASADNPDRIATKVINHSCESRDKKHTNGWLTLYLCCCLQGGMRDRSKINRLRMYKSGKPVRNKNGKVKQSSVAPISVPRQPRLINQEMSCLSDYWR